MAYKDKQKMHILDKGMEINRDTVAKWLNQDLQSVAGIVHLIQTDQKLFDGMVDVLFERIQNSVIQEAKQDTDA